MKTKKEIKALVDEVFKDDPEPEKEKLINLLSPKARLQALREHINIQKETLDMVEPYALHGAKFRGGKRGPGYRSEAWRERLSSLAKGLEDDRLNFQNILKRLEKSILANIDFWDEILHDEELIFFTDSSHKQHSISFKTIKNELSILRKKNTPHKK